MTSIGLVVLATMTSLLHGQPGSAAPTCRGLASVIDSTGVTARDIPTPRLDALRRQFEQLSRLTGGTAGILAWHVESGARVSVHAQMAFPMQSVYKFPIAIALLRRVERGEIRLDDSVAFRRGDVRIQYSPLSRQYPTGGIWLTVRQIVRATIGSDGAASDIALRLSGGASTVTHMLDSLGIRGIRIDRSELMLQADYVGLTEFPTPEEWSSATLERAWQAVSPATRQAALRRYLRDPRDTATPDAMGELWYAFLQGKVLGPGMTLLLSNFLEHNSPNVSRAAAFLPIGTHILQKTGTSGTTDGVIGTANIAALITLPEGRGHLIFIAFVKGARRTPVMVDSAIGRTARSAFDTFCERR